MLPPLLYPDTRNDADTSLSTTVSSHSLAPRALDVASILYDAPAAAAAPGPTPSPVDPGTAAPYGECGLDV